MRTLLSVVLVVGSFGTAPAVAGEPAAEGITLKNAFPRSVVCRVYRDQRMQTNVKIKAGGSHAEPAPERGAAYTLRCPDLQVNSPWSVEPGKSYTLDPRKRRPVEN